jgi:hypothetical protein
MSTQRRRDGGWAPRAANPAGSGPACGRADGVEGNDRSTPRRAHSGRRSPGSTERLFASIQ